MEDVGELLITLLFYFFSLLQAVEALVKYPCFGTRNALIDIIKQNEAFFRVRTASTTSLAKEFECFDVLLCNTINFSRLLLPVLT